ncbi:hypothetical protein CDAR_588291 [Caerostris darwini]|uniref:Uncharacterized protein n=1 Tax=Caerostris darwini TaxID=1538125 RepID=A0AAV4S5B6_9ARAC|nr:hypothetical protein CDAR_588291 [Caerostris darwini]
MFHTTSGNTSRLLGVNPKRKRKKVQKKKPPEFSNSQKFRSSPHRPIHMYEASGTLAHIAHCLLSFSGMRFLVSPVKKKEKEKKHRPRNFQHYHDSVNLQRVRDLIFGATEAKIKGDSFQQIMGVYVECLVGAVILLSNRGFGACFMAELEAIQRYALTKYR